MNIQFDDIVFIIDKTVLDDHEHDHPQTEEGPSLMESIRVYKEGVEKKRAEREQSSTSGIVMKIHDYFKEDKVSLSRRLINSVSNRK